MSFLNFNCHDHQKKILAKVKMKIAVFKGD